MAILLILFQQNTIKYVPPNFLFGIVFNLSCKEPLQLIGILLENYIDFGEIKEYSVPIEILLIFFFI